MFAVVVTIALHPGRAEAFLPLMHQNAQLSLSTEPECHRFDICTDPDRPEDVLLYELYSDAAAFAAHLETPHFKTFDAETADMIATKTATTYQSVMS